MLEPFLFQSDVVHTSGLYPRQWRSILITWGNFSTHMCFHILGLGGNVDIILVQFYVNSTYIYFCHSCEVITYTKNNLYEQYKKQDLWIIMFGGLMWYMNMSIYTYFCYYWWIWLNISIKIFSEFLMYDGTKQNSNGLLLYHFGLQHYIGACYIQDICTCIVFYFSSETRNIRQTNVSMYCSYRYRTTDGWIPWLRRMQPWFSYQQEYSQYWT